MSNDDLGAVLDALREDSPYCPATVLAWTEGQCIGRRRLPNLRSSMMHVQLRCVVVLALETGLRPSELHRLTVDDVDPINESIPVGRRFVPYSDLARRQVRSWLAHRALLDLDHGRLWVSLNGSWGAPVSLERFRRWLDGVGGIRVWKRLRATFACRSVAAGMCMGVVAYNLGIRDPAYAAAFLGVDRERVVAETSVFSDDRAESYPAGIREIRSGADASQLSRSFDMAAKP